MDADMIELHEQLIRLARGMLSAWERWVGKKKAKQPAT